MVVLAAAAYVGVRLTSAVPAAVVTPVMAQPGVVRAPAVALPWPTAGHAAVAVPAIGIDVPSGPQGATPMASLAKMMTAYVILHDHPLSPGAEGPSITITQADLDDYNRDTGRDEANAQVSAGEVLTERQILGGAMVHSADNYADTLARWDAGSIGAFVARMNRAAVTLGMRHTVFADPSGFDQGSQSTAGDLLKVAAPDMGNPTFASLVQMTSITLPVAGTIATYTPLLGFEGVVGVKSGYTQQAGGCDVLAVVRRVHGSPVLILAAVTGQTGPNVLHLAGLQALGLADAVGAAIGTTPVVRTGEVVARVTVAGHSVEAAATSSASLLSWPGVRPRWVIQVTRPVTGGARRGTRIGSVVVSMGTQRAVVPVVLLGDLPRETLTQRLF